MAITTECADLARQVIEMMRQRTLTLATCESITGGGIGSALTSVPGASAVYRGGFITYASDLKATLAGVHRELITEKGVVNELTAIQMARERCVAATPIGASPRRGWPARRPSKASPSARCGSRWWGRRRACPVVRSSRSSCTSTETARPFARRARSTPSGCCCASSESLRELVEKSLIALGINPNASWLDPSDASNRLADR